MECKSNRLMMQGFQKSYSKSFGNNEKVAWLYLFKYYFLLLFRLKQAEIANNSNSLKKTVFFKENSSKFTGKYLHKVFFLVRLQAVGWLWEKNFRHKKETLAQVFSCKFWNFFQDTYFIEHCWVISSRETVWRI